MKRRPRSKVVRGRRTPAAPVEHETGLRELVTYLARGLVDDPSAVLVAEQRRAAGALFELQVGPGDQGNVIGRNGRTAQAMRTLLALAAPADKPEAVLDILD